MALNERECNVSGKSKSTRTVSECSPNTGPTCDDGATCEPFRLSRGKNARAATTSCAHGTVAMPTTVRRKNARRSKTGRTATEPPPTTATTQDGTSMLFAVATRAKRTAVRGRAVTSAKRASAITSSALLRHFAHELWYARILHTSGEMLPGLGGDFDLSWNRLVTLCCPSDSERVALGLTINGNDCLCLVSLPTPTASDWRGGKRKRKKGTQANLRDEYTQATGYTYLPIEGFTAVQGFPDMWTALDHSETQSSRKSHNGSAEES